MSLQRLGRWYEPGADASHKLWTNYDLQLKQSTSLAFLSQGNPYDGDHYTRGGNFLTERIDTEYTPSASSLITTSSYAPNYGYSGKVIAVPPTSPTFNPDLRDLGVVGVEQFSKASPTRRPLELGNALYELKDVPGLLLQRLSGNGLRDLGSYYLALEFGWKPLLADIRDFVYLHRRLMNQVQQLVRSQSRGIRRTRSVLNDSSTTITGRARGYELLNPLFVTSWYGSVPECTYTRTEQTRIWYSAKYRYWISPDIANSRWTAETIAKVYGLSPGPAQIYRAIPWSWLFDWFATTGDIINNLDAGLADSVYTDYAYVMRSKIVTNHATVTGTFRGPNDDLTTLSATTAVSHIKKEREAATPFYFGFKSPLDLSPGQHGILAALAAQRR